MEFKTTSLASLLLQLNNYEWGALLYCEGAHPYAKDTICAVLNDEQLVKSGGEATLVTRANLHYVLNMQDVQGIEDNAKQQKASVSLEELVEAFNFYIANDAFIEWV